MARKLRMHDATCKHCAKRWQVTNRLMVPPKFCSRSCCNNWSYSHGRLSSFSRQARIGRLGVDVVNAQAAALFHTFTCEHCNETVTKRRRKPLSRFCNRTCSSQFTALHGRRPHFSVEQRQAQSMRMANQLTSKPENAYSWPTIKGWYKGVFFRSSYEYRFMQWLETSGISVLHDLETDTFRIPYELNGTKHMYVPDFYVPRLNTVYEVKSTYAVKNDPRVAVKAAAAKDHLASLGKKYVIVTEIDFPIPLKNSRSDIATDPCVFLLEKLPIDDTLALMFSEQRKFMELLQKERGFPSFPVDLSSKVGQRLVKEISHDCMHELFEAVHLLRNSKSHRKTDVSEFNRDAFLEELADVLHYLVEIFIVSGISPEEMYRAYMKKGTINTSRILSDY